MRTMRVDEPRCGRDTRTAGPRARVGLPNRTASPTARTEGARPMSSSGTLLPSAPMEIMGVQIRTIIKDNVATRCDGCLQVIDGTPWRINLLDIVAAESPVAWTDRPAVNPGPFQFHGDPALRPTLDGRQGLLVLSPRRGSRDHASHPDPGRPTSLGPVRRDPSRRSRVRPRLIDRGRSARLSCARSSRIADTQIRLALRIPSPSP